MTDPPIELTGAALDKWAELVAVLETRNKKASRPRPTNLVDLAAYCAAFGRWHDAEAWLAHPDHGPVLTIRDDKGNIKSHGPAPQLTIAERASKEMTRLARLLRI